MTKFRFSIAFEHARKYSIMYTEILDSGKIIHHLIYTVASITVAQNHLVALARKIKPKYFKMHQISLYVYEFEPIEDIFNNLCVGIVL